jgi:taurine--2-oxoglutarate transaminase
VTEPFFFTWTSQRDAAPLHITGAGHGVFIEIDGVDWLDFGSLIYQTNAGHAHAGIVEAIRAQAAKLCVSFPNAVYPEKVALAKKLLEHAPPGFTKVFFTLGGADANENALKMARLATKRYKTVSRYRSYHGATLGAISLTGDWRRPPAEPGAPGAIHVLDLAAEPPPGHTSFIPQTLELEGDVGAVFLEPVVGGNGVLIPPRGYFEEVRRACTAHGALLVIDEVLTGFGRTGKWFAFEHWNAEPDMITCGKALTAGYGTLGAVLVHERIASLFEDRVLPAGLTSYGHPLSVAAALAAIEVYEREGLVENAARLGPVLTSGLSELAKKHSIVERTRAIGMLGALDLSLDAAGFGRLSKALREERIHAHVLKRVHALIVSPPLCITEAEMADGLARIDRALARSAA